MRKKNLSAKKKTHNFYSKNLKNKRIKKIYLRFKNNLASYSPKKLSVAVSGGADSIALVFLVKCYALENKLKTFFYIVDHKLRKDSTLEARLVKKKLSSFNILCEILTLKTYRNKSNIQSFARNNRYSVIFKKCLKNKVDYLLTAHHKDDYVENFFIRLLRGSGLKGLTSFGNFKSKISSKNKTFILRPLLNISKKELIYISKNTFNFYVDDPSNLDDKYTRVRVRKLIYKLEQEGLNFNKFKLLLDNLNKSNNAIDFYVKKNILINTNILIQKKSLILNDMFFQQPDEIVFRSFIEVIQKIGGQDKYSRGKKVISLLNYLKSKNVKKKTLSGCIIQKIGKSIVISQEK